MVGLRGRGSSHAFWFAMAIYVAACGGRDATSARTSSSGGQSAVGGASGAGEAAALGAGGEIGDPTFGGFAKTREGHFHRPALGICPDLLASLPEPAPPVVVLDGGPAAPKDECTRHSDCSLHPHGSCVLAQFQRSPLGAIPYLACAYGCVRDEDCASSGEICRCGTVIGTCVPASCKTDAECGAELCTEFTSDPPSGCGETASPYFKCAVPGVECNADADCDTEHRCSAMTCRSRTAC